MVPNPGAAGALHWGARRLKPYLSPRWRGTLRRIASTVLAGICRRNLTALATLYGTDKWNYHWYASHYQAHFTPLRLKRVTILEIGIGGYADANSGGESLRMWRSFFPRGLVYGLDLYDKRALQGPRLRIFQCDQADRDQLAAIAQDVGPLDIVIDDGSHRNTDVLATFEVLFPFLKEGGFYAVEDTQTSYWPRFGGDSENLTRTDTTMGFFKSLVDRLNHDELRGRENHCNPYDGKIAGMYFYHNLVLIEKAGRRDADEHRSNSRKHGGPIP